MTDRGAATPVPSAGGCPFAAGRTLPVDGTQLAPSPTLAAWRAEADATPLTYSDGHDGWIVTGHALAQAVLADPRFTRQVTRFPLPGSGIDELDDAARESLRTGVPLDNDGEVHARLRRTLTPRFSLRAARGHRERIAAIVRGQLASFTATRAPADLTSGFAEPISAAVHCLVMGVPDSFADRYSRLFVGRSSSQQKFDFTREVLARKREDPADDVLSDLVRSDLTPSAIEGLAFMVLTAGRDSVAHVISTAVVALLTNPGQWDALRDDPGRLPAAVEEFVRVGSLFLTLFSRTATEDVVIGEFTVRAGQSVSVSPAAANRDERVFADPDAFDVARDAFGHIGFGYGIHGCVGQQVARVAIAEAVGALIAELPGLRLVEAEQLSPMPFAHPVATYSTGAVVVDWEDALAVRDRVLRGG